ncbi:winged helix family transcriptional regulator [Enterococcus sp. 5H]|uniref:winged helix family transcriptional regulator n=1 Tax=Enterococcus sp. 5H TaxID=1229490 RepID=UPI00230401E1|nr:winged helix-turn-helix domain-containing protein [Enterococcus sp. 5H]MDA9472552.1 transcriptional regulator [Enterococcus sp. 5H]
MFKVIFLSNDQDIKNKYEEDCVRLDIDVISGDSQSVNQVLEKVDALIIDEDIFSEFINICEFIMDTRRLSKIFIWILSRKNSQTNNIIYLQLGVDGVFKKETSSEEVSLSINRFLYRNHEKSDVDKQFSGLSKGTRERETYIELNPTTLTINLPNKRIIYLTKLEYIVLDLLLNNIGEVITYRDIRLYVFEKEYMELYRVTNLIFRLRKKLKSEPGCRLTIKTIRNTGYLLNT